MPDRRSKKRRHLVFYLECFDKSSGHLLGHLGDVTTEGFMLVRPEPVELGTKLSIVMELPPALDGPRRLEITGEARWCRPDANPDLFNIGFQRCVEEPIDIEAISKLVELFAFRD